MRTHPSGTTSRASDRPYLQTPQGLSFFLEACRTAAGRWRGGVRIHARDMRRMVRIPCEEEFATEADALRDAGRCARDHSRRIEERSRQEASAHRAHEPSWDDRRKAEALSMAFLCLDREGRAPAVRTAAEDPFGTIALVSGDPQYRSQAQGLRERSCALIDELRASLDRSERPGGPDAGCGGICRTGKKGRAAP